MELLFAENTPVSTVRSIRCIHGRLILDIIIEAVRWFAPPSSLGDVIVVGILGAVVPLSTMEPGDTI